MFAFDESKQAKGQKDANKLRKLEVTPTPTFFAGKDEHSAVVRAKLDKVRRLYKKQSPKIGALMEAIAQRDKIDWETSKTLYKHVIYTDVKDAAYGVKLLTSIFLSEGYEIAKFSRPKVTKFRKNGEPRKGKEAWEVIAPHLEGEAKDQRKSFVALSSGGMSGAAFFAPGSFGFDNIPPTEDKNLIKNAVFKKFNKRPKGECPVNYDDNDTGNVYGKNIRFLIMDKGFKEGVDIYDAKYMWIMEPPMSKASLTQAVGRVLRLCGAKCLPPNEWKVYITVLANTLPTEDEKLVYHLTVDNFQKASAKTRSLFMKEGLNAAADKFLTQELHEYRSPETDAKKAIIKSLGIP
jgi:hypothetical protein